MKKSHIVAPIMVLTLGLLLAGCSGGTDTAGNAANGNPSGQTDLLNGNAAGNTMAPGEKNGPGMEPQTPPALTDEQTQQLQAGKADHAPTTLTFTVDGGNFYFVPNEIRVKKGDAVKIVFKNDGGFHNWVLDDFNVTMTPIKTGDTADLQFVADKTGSFEYYCSVGKHRAMGMKGTLVVE